MIYDLIFVGVGQTVTLLVPPGQSTVHKTEATQGDKVIL